MQIDYLQRTQDLDNLITVIHNLSQMKTGSTFAINGRWGCGKTFLLNLLEEKLKANCEDPSEESRYFIVRYDCWKNNFYTEPIIPMLSSVIEALDLESSNVTDGILNAIKETSSEYIGALLKNTIGFNPINIVDNLDKHIQKQQEATFAFDNIFALKKALNNVRGSLEALAENKTILFIVDELDRCLPEYSIRVLENIHHIFSGIDNFITLLAIDRDELTQVIKTAYGTDIDTSAYLKKIIDFYVQLDFGKPASDYLDKYADFFSHFFGFDTSINWCNSAVPTLMAFLDIRTQEKIWKKAELIHNMITNKALDCSCLVYELVVLIQDYCTSLHSAQAAAGFQNILNGLLEDYSKDIMETYYSGKAYYELADHPAARIIWYQEGWELLQNPPASQPKNPSVRIQHICPYADSIKDEDELMQKFTQLSRIIE
ncbi:KAP family P-loop NTPase fold protein [Blautia sp. NSJ-166]|uniref:KAP family P-loop NTPase fold protein n=1 Tax=Blautia sp. NSJ-166 TaxID=2931882 RepID=UPI000E5D1D3A|nr:P-loop NTPase fold protein [Blautia sp. NSJ-166]MCJ8046597.1 KAP family NTPase [Blautia sp. NSJ-166]RGF85844.1 hypothetical protein DXA65_07855 [Ruminococcus sp. OF03-6AA]